MAYNLYQHEYFNKAQDMELYNGSMAEGRIGKN